MHSRFPRVALVATTAAVLSLPAVAHGGTANPVKNGNYCMNCTKKLAPGDFHVAKNGRSIDAWSYYNNCAPVPVPTPPKIPIKNGHFSFSGTLTDVTKKKIHFVLKGSFVTSHLATGTAQATGGGKTCKAVTFKAKFTRTGPFQG